MAAKHNVVRELLDTVARGEGSDYNTPFGYGKFVQPKKDLTKMTMAEVRSYQNKLVADTRGRGIQGLKPNQGTSAVGKYQLTRAAIQDAINAGIINEGDTFTPEVQDKIASLHLELAGLSKVLSGEMTPEKYRKNLSKKWASIQGSKARQPIKTASSDVEGLFKTARSPKNPPQKDSQPMADKLYYIYMNKQTGKTKVVSAAASKRIHPDWERIGKGDGYKQRGRAHNATMKAKEKAQLQKYFDKVDASNSKGMDKSESAADAARRVSGAKGLGVLEGELEREQKGRAHGADLRVPGADVNKRKGIGGAAHKDIKATTSAEKRAAGEATGFITGIPLIKDVVEGISTLPDIVNREVSNKKLRQDEADQKMNPRTPGSTTGKKEKYMAEVDAKEAEKQKREAEKQKRLVRRRDLQKRLQGEVPPSVGDRQGPGMDAPTPAPKPALKSSPPRTPVFKGVGGVPTYGPAPLNKASATTEADPLPKDTTKRPVPQKVAGSTSGKKEAFMKRKTASELATGPGDDPGDPAEMEEQRARQKALELQKAKTRNKALYHSSRQADDSAGGEFGKLGVENRHPDSRPQTEFSRAQPKKLTSAKQDKAIRMATAAQGDEFSPGVKKKPSPSRPNVGLGSRGRKYEATDVQERDWERMREENQGARKGGKITKKKATRKQAAPKKSSTSHRSRPKNPTLQKTSYNY